MRRDSPSRLHPFLYAARKIMTQTNETYSARGIRAQELFAQGYNCCQSVLLAFGDMTGLDDKTAARVASGFGGGIGMLRDVCGTFTGACMALGMIEGYDQPGSNEIKKELFAKIREFAGRFTDDNGSYICRELKGIDPPKENVGSSAQEKSPRRKRPCPELCAYSAQLLETLLLEHAND